MASRAPPRPGLNRRGSVKEAHDIYVKYHRFKPSGRDIVNEKEESLAEKAHSTHAQEHKTSGTESFPMFHSVQKTGVIYATARARKYGFSHENEEWANMGQGAPETGPLNLAPARSFNMKIEDAELEYAPVTGNQELREKIATYYNHLYRQGKESMYSAENVCVVPGGRAGLTRIMAVLGEVQVGYFTPDYTAYEQALGLFVRISPSPLLHRDVNEAIMPAEEFNFQLGGRGVGAMLLSNPANPTGQSIEGDLLKSYVKTAREQESAVIFDEFYSHYYYDGTAVDPQDGGADDDTNWPKTVSSASYVENVNQDPVIIVNGLTKNWRCPGFRVCWIVAPKEIVGMLASAGSYLDGGANAPLQRLALPLMDLEFVRKDTWALQRHFKEKRDFCLQELAKLGIHVQWTPTATFYIWADLSKLPPPLNDCLVFLEECVRHKVVCVPGVFFDINPRGCRNVHKSKCLSNRFSYGPPIDQLQKGMKQIGEMIQKWTAMPESANAYATDLYGSSGSK